jgi:hypothetical protein
MTAVGVRSESWPLSLVRCAVALRLACAARGQGCCPLWSASRPKPVDGGREQGRHRRQRGRADRAVLHTTLKPDEPMFTAGSSTPASEVGPMHKLWLGLRCIIAVPVSVLCCTIGLSVSSNSDRTSFRYRGVL